MTNPTGPLFFPAESPTRKSVIGKAGGHYNVFKTNDTESAWTFLHEVFGTPPEAGELNFVLFSTSGVHGSYTVLEDIEESLTKYGETAPDGEDCPDGFCFPELTFLLVQPRIVSMTYGNVRVTLERVEWLKKLRESSRNAVQGIGF